jgi:putative ABC transport system permease protein
VLTEYHHADAANIVYGKDVPFPMPGALKTAFPQVEQVAPIFASHDDKLLVVGDNGTTLKQFKETKGVIFTEPSFFKYLISPCSQARMPRCRNRTMYCLPKRSRKNISATGKQP